MRLQAIRSWARAARARNSPVMRVADTLRALGRAEGRARLWTGIAHAGAVHQTSGTTFPDRYPELFDQAARLAPHAARILSFGCSSGEELEALRRRWPDTEIVGAEINPRLRRLAAARMAADGKVAVVAPQSISGRFDLVFALAVLQRLPERIERHGIADLSRSYPFDRFDVELARLAERLRPGGLLCVMNAHYRVEDSSAAAMLAAVPDSPAMSHPLFGRDSRRLPADLVARSIFRKV